MDDQDAERIYHEFCRRGAVDLRGAEAAGMIAKNQLEHGATYIGHCRNTKEAVWDANANAFIFTRDKFGMKFEDDAQHPADDKGFDIFVPVQKKESE